MKRSESAAAGRKASSRFKAPMILALAGIVAALWIRLHFSESGSTMSHCMQGVDLARSGRYAEAVTIWERVRREAPNFPYPYFQLAVFNARTGHPLQAIALLKSLVRLDPRFPEAQVTLAETCDRVRDRPCALNAAREAVWQEPNSIRTHLALSAAYGHFFDYGDCVKEALTAEELAPGDPTLALRCAGIYQEAGDAAMTEAQARRYLQNPSKNAQESAKAYYLLGWGLTHKAASAAQEKEAIQAFETSISRDAYNPKPPIELGALLVQQRRDREAIPILETGRRLASLAEAEGEFSRIHLEARARVARLLAIGYARTGKKEQAQQRLEECRQLAAQAALLTNQSGN